MGLDLGAFGNEREPVDASFLYCGRARIRVHPDITDLGFVDFMDRAKKIDVEALLTEQVDRLTPEQMRMLDSLFDFLHEQIHPDDWDLFMSTARAARQNLADLIALSKQLVEAASGFPTRPRSDSSVTPSTTPPSSAPASRSPVAVYEQALRATEGRPDLQAVVLRRYLETQPA